MGCSPPFSTQSLIRCIGVAAFAAWSCLASAAEVSQWELDLSRGIAYRKQGNLELSIDMLARSARAASTDHERMRSAGELGASLLQARRFDQAAVSLREAYSFFSGAERARYAIDLGNLVLIRKREKERSITTMKRSTLPPAMPRFVSAPGSISHVSCLRASG
jgi:Flp pilus assembly protein TadD